MKVHYSSIYPIKRYEHDELTSCELREAELADIRNILLEGAFRRGEAVKVEFYSDLSPIMGKDTIYLTVRELKKIPLDVLISFGIYPLSSCP